MGRTGRRRRAQVQLRRLGPLLAEILAEILEESKPRLRQWDRQLTDWVRSHRWGVDPSLPKVAIYVLGAVVVLAIPILTLAVLVAIVAFLAVQVLKKWPQADPPSRWQGRYLPGADEDVEPPEEDWA